MLECKDTWLPVLDGESKPENINASTWDAMHLKTTSYIRCFIHMCLYNTFVDETKAHELWRKIETMFQTKNALNRVSVFRKLVRLRYQDGSSMAEHLNTFQGLISQTVSLDIPLANEVLTLLLLGSLPDSWETLVVTLGTATQQKDLTLDMLKSSLLHEEARRKEHESNFDHKALVIENNSARGRNHARGPQNHENNSKGRSKSRHRKDFTCHYCGGPNHYERDCRKKKRDQKSGTTDNKKNDSTTAACDGDIILACDDACVSLASQETDWIIDSGASYHITPYREMFSSYAGGDFGKVKMANHGVTEVVGIGNIILTTDMGCKLVLKDVRHVPDIRLNIISAGKLDDEGYTNSFGEGKWKLIKGSLVLAKCLKQNSLYVLHVVVSGGEVNVANKDASIELWHKRLGHMSQKGLDVLARKNILPDIKV